MRVTPTGCATLRGHLTSASRAATLPPRLRCVCSLFFPSPPSSPPCLWPRRVLELCAYELPARPQDKTVLIWTKDTPTAPWHKTVLDPTAGAVSPAPGKFPDVVWRVSWSLAGNILAISCGDGKVTLWKENLKGVWECVSDMTS